MTVKINNNDIFIDFDEEISSKSLDSYHKKLKEP